jgi:hypothetical protein
MTIFANDRGRPTGIWSMNHEKIRGAGEDADPLIMVSEDRSFGVVAAFDGLGGAGGERFATDAGEQTGARIAASLGRNAVAAELLTLWGEAAAIVEPIDFSGSNGQSDLSEQEGVGHRIEPRFRRYVERVTHYGAGPIDRQHAQAPPAPRDPFELITPERFGRTFDRVFSAEAERLRSAEEASRVKTRMRRKLPTTFAAGFFRQTQGTSRVRVMWSGDSRIYFASVGGFRRLTEDHVRAGHDGTTSPEHDSPLTAYISEQVPNRVAVAEFQFAEPGLLIACSDGAYGYFTNPAQFEVSILSALIAGQSTKEQSEKLRQILTQVAQDDVSLAMVPLGTFTPRDWDRLRQRHDAIKKVEASLRRLQVETKAIAVQERQLTERLKRDFGYD